MEDFIKFNNRILESKHGIWFGLLTHWRKKSLYRDWINYKYRLNRINKSPSLRKFLWNSRKHKSYAVPTAKLRDKQLEVILEKN